MVITLFQWVFNLFKRAKRNPHISIFFINELFLTLMISMVFFFLGSIFIDDVDFNVVDLLCCLLYVLIVVSLGDVRQR